MTALHLQTINGLLLSQPGAGSFIRTMRGLKIGKKVYSLQNQDEYKKQY